MRKRIMRVLQNPRFMKMLSDERVAPHLMRILRTQGEIQVRIDRATEALAKSMNFATPGEVRELKRALRTLERRIEREEQAR
ncbi:MAG: hypothetical protein AAGF12_38815 [Myxococcota bacterium]